MKIILEKIINKELCRCNDELHAEGMWDVSSILVSNYTGELSMDSAEQLQGDIYDTLWDIVDALQINKCKTCK